MNDPPLHTNGEMVIFTILFIWIVLNILWMFRKYLRKGGGRLFRRDVDKEYGRDLRTIRTD